MGGSKKNRRKNPADDTGVDLLSLAFNLPTRRDFERADKEAGQSQIHTQSIRIQYDAGEDESSDAGSSAVSQADSNRPDTQDADETPRARKTSKPRQHHVKEQKNTRSREVVLKPSFSQSFVSSLFHPIFGHFSPRHI
ncbi:hypothetical protein TrVFT333_005362 [Trichoderma virens FT-333]|nr:hypothetical protein TrVFT333_005362 [Trichoderma virens FT-333]